MCKTLIILILLFDGTLVKEPLEFEKPVTVADCLMFADDHREGIAIYREDGDANLSGWYLKDGRGTVQGFICE
jgi:hypothetical protein